VINIVRIISI